MVGRIKKNNRKQHMKGDVLLLILIGAIIFWAMYLMGHFVRPPTTLHDRIYCLFTGLVGTLAGFFLLGLVVSLCTGYRRPSEPAPKFATVLSNLFANPEYLLGLLITLATFAASAWSIA